MGFSIGRIKNEAIKEFAKGYDKDNSKDLNATEYSLFLEDASKKFTAKDILLAIDVEDAVEEKVDVVEISTKQNNASTPEELKGKKSGKDRQAHVRAKNLVMAQVSRLLNKGVTRDDLIDNIDLALGTNANEPNYVEVKKSITDVMEIMDGFTYETLKDINKNHAQVLKAMNKAGIKDADHMAILKKLEKFVEYEIRLEAFNGVDDMYDNAPSKTDEGTKRTDEQIMKDVKSGLKADGSYKKREVRQAYKDYENTTIMYRANEKSDAAIRSIEGETRRRKVQKGAQELLEKQDGEWDKYTRKPPLSILPFLF